MLKVVNLPDGKQLELRSSAATAILYKNQFGTDFFADMIKLAKTFSTMQDTGEETDDSKEDELDLSKMSYEDLDRLDMSTLYQVTWAFAKNADDKIGDLVSWLGGFDDFPLMDIFPAVMELIERLFKTTKN